MTCWGQYMMVLLTVTGAATDAYNYVTGAGTDAYNYVTGAGTDALRNRSN
jgi:hypothetical protein